MEKKQTKKNNNFLNTGLTSTMQLNNIPRGEGALTSNPLAKQKKKKT